ncbi:NAD-dependent epimerase/dehydratase family protein [Mycolicibacterium parafortuitum]|uniref:Putative oxidoreductase [Mycobacterium tuberculosis H37Rv] n=1 Tax=Mycolicibacterium parafortuitum TaxID=39692 RepID=A0A375YCQ1_MYCPF|nr:NAD-dependent epimerase/dehydratase family protein [Mycolicibacterium parafortuitum]ORB27019.1 NAD-dependent dehydratase [Mycolicibacterium parafortuitum]SRX78903.1 putative oxidoreductase [Mycobacterium tuberculosis H37Rv] [Mycolicibacterium parafortuitum]
MTALVIGANGYLGSHVTRQLVAAGQDVRVMVRDGANTVGIDDLAVTRFVGDIWNSAVLREAMTGCDVVYYCVVDTRGWLRDPAPLFRTNVDGTRNVLDVAVEPEIAAGLRKFVFTSSYVTVGRKRGRVATEADVIADPATLTPYVRSRVQAENLVMEYARERGLPAVAMCVSTTYGAGDWGRTPHGAIIAGAAFGKLPFVMSGIELEAVGIDDAAAALLLAADKGRAGERYLISEKMISNGEVVRIAAEAAGVPAPSRSVPLALSYAMAALGSVKAKLTGTDERMSLGSLRLMRAEAPVDCSKARRELGWQPRPVEESIREAARFWVGLRDAKRRRSA